MNRKAGIKLPQIPTIDNGRIFFRIFSLEMAFNANGKRTRVAISIRREPTWLSVKIATSSEVNIAFFIRMKELPQTQASAINKAQLFNSLVTCKYTLKNEFRVDLFDC